MSQTLPAVAGGATNSLRKLLEQSKQQIAVALPRHMTPERMIRVAITAFHRTPALQECSPISILGCVIQASELGLELTGPLGQAYMVPYFNKHSRQKEAQFQVGYRGLMDLAFRSGRVESFAARVVYAGDHFRYALGTSPKIDHVPTMGEPGEPIAVYAVLRTKGGGVDFEVMSAAQIDAHRKRYSKQTSDRSPWETAWEEMAKKTVIRRLAKRAPVSVEFQRAAMADEYAEAGVPQGLLLDAPEPALPTGRVSLRPPAQLVEEPEPEADPAPEPQDQPAQDGDQAAYADWRDDYGERLKSAETPLALQEVARHLTGAGWITDDQRKECMDAYQDRHKELSPEKKKSK